MDKLTQLYQWLQGKRTYFIALTIGVDAALQYLGIQVPAWAFTLQGALGLGSLRAAVKNDVTKAVS